MNELKVFENYEFGNVRAVQINGEPWLVGKDVAEALGYSNPRKALIDHVDDEDKGVTKCDTLGGEQDMIIINESGLYSLVLSSKLPGAKKFKKWVTSVVLPSIRNNGGYIAGQEILSDAELIAKALIVAERTLAERSERLAIVEEKNALMQPKADYFDELVERNTLTNFRVTAKELGVKPKRFVNYLLEQKYIYRDKKGNLLPYEGKNEGLFEVKECYCDKNAWSGTQTLITPKGRETFRILCRGI